MTRLYVGLDVSQRLTHICAIDQAGNRVWQGKCPTEPAAIAETIRARIPGATSIGMESGALSPCRVRPLPGREHWLSRRAHMQTFNLWRNCAKHIWETGASDANMERAIGPDSGENDEPAGTNKAGEQERKN